MCMYRGWVATYCQIYVIVARNASDEVEWFRDGYILMMLVFLRVDVQRTHEGH